VIVGEDEAAMFAPAGAGFEGPLASGVDGGGRVVLEQIAKSNHGFERLGSSPINGGSRPLAAGFARRCRPFHPLSVGGEHWSAHFGDSEMRPFRLPSGRGLALAPLRSLNKMRAKRSGYPIASTRWPVYFVGAS
jgi:hypothetical protein